MYSRTLVLRFPADAVDKPIITTLVRKFELECNILRAHIYPRREGMLVMRIAGHRDQYVQGIEYLKSIGLTVEHISQEIRRNEELCYQCGACTGVCVTNALHIKRPEMEVRFDSDLCSGCELCVRTCPTHAMVVTLDKVLEL